MGQGIFNPIDRGGSSDAVFVSTFNGSFAANNPAGGQTNFGGTPVANLGWEIIGSAPPTAARSSVAGRVISNGKGLANARVELTGTGGTIRTVLTNSFGNSTISEVDSGATYVVNVAAKGRTFAPQVVSVTDNISDSLSRSSKLALSFADVRAGETYIVMAAAKRYTFGQSSQVINAVANLDTLNIHRQSVKSGNSVKLDKSKISESLICPAFFL